MVPTLATSLLSHLPPVLLRQVKDSCVGGCLNGWKIGFAALLIVEGLLFGHIVYLIKRLTASSTRKFSFAFHLGNSLSGGVFFAAGMLHILPEAIALVSGEHAEEEEHGDHERFLSFRQEDDEEDDPDHSEEEAHSEGFPWALFVVMVSYYVFFFLEKILVPRLLGSGQKKVEKSDEEQKTDEELGHLTESHTADEDPNLVVSSDGFRSREFFMALIEVLGISAHSFFESIALGLSGSFSTVLNIFIATVAHRWATSAAIGFKLLKTLGYFPFLVLILLFSAIAPIGIGIGAALSSVSQTVQGILFSISAGTFLYIGMYEVMSEEFVEHRPWPLQKFMMTLAGAGVITLVTVILTVLDIHG